MRSESVYSVEDVRAICEEIDRQWECHLIARAVFPPNLSSLEETGQNLISYQSAEFYQQHDIRISVQFTAPLADILSKRLPVLPHWLNQNFVIRLYGILDEHRVITAGRRYSNPFTRILADLRHRVGAHTSGASHKQSSNARKLAKMIRLHLDNRVNEQDVTDYNLAIDSVLARLKDHCVEFVRTLEGRERPRKKASKCLFSRGMYGRR